MRKAQVASIDLFIAITAFIFLIAATAYTWNIYNTRLAENIEYEKMELAAFQITDLMVKSQGYPSAWEEIPAEVQVIGLAQDDRLLSQDKVDAFMNLDYGLAKERFNIELYDYKFRLKDLANNMLQESGLDFTGDTSIVIERYIIFGDEKAILEFTLWK